jgi:hypothetical protein
MALHHSIGEGGTNILRVGKAFFVPRAQRGHSLRCKQSCSARYGTIPYVSIGKRREPVLEVLSRDLQAYRERIDALGEHL